MKKQKQNGESLVKERGGVAQNRALSRVKVRRIITAILAFVFAFTIAGCAAYPGTFPFGIAAVASSTGVLFTLAATLGAVLGSVRIHAVGGAYALAAVLLTIGRIVSSVYISSENLASEVRDKKKRWTSITGSVRRMFRSPRDEIGDIAKSLGNFSGIMLRENIRVRLALCGAAALLSGAWSVVEGGYLYYDLLGAVISLVTTPIITYLFYAASERCMRVSPMREFALYFTAGTVTLALHSLSEGVNSAGITFNFGVLFALFVTMAIALHFGVHKATLCGLVCGLAMEPIYIPSFALGGVACAIVSKWIGRERGKTVGVIAGGAVASAWAVHVGGLGGMTAIFAPAVVASSVLVPLVRHNILKLPSTLFGEHTTSSVIPYSVSEGALLDMRRRVEAIGGGMGDVAGLLESLSKKLTKPDREDLYDIVTDTFEAHCSLCRNRDRCHGGKNSKTAGVMRAMTDELSAGGSATASVVPSSIAAACYNMGRILDEINLRAGKLIASLRSSDKLSVISSDLALSGELVCHTARVAEESTELDEETTKKLARAFSAGNFVASGVAVYGGRTKRVFVSDVDLSAARLGGDDIQKLVEEICGVKMTLPEFELDGATLSMKMCSTPTFRCEAGTDFAAASGVRVYCSDKRSSDVDSAQDGEALAGEVSGDTVTSFEADGKFYMIISDGMGSGREAALTSGVCAALLSRLITSGADLDTAIKMTSAIIRACGRECSTTVDIAQIDLYTGEARFIKSGAAPSFVLRDGGIFRLQSKTVPIGIMRALDAEMIKFDVQSGDRVVMVSDGISRSYDECPWLLDMMTLDEDVISGTADMASRKIVAEAVRRSSEDDVTAGVIVIGKR